MLVLVLVIMMFSCELPDYFAEYSDTDGDPINLIGGFVLPTYADPTLNRNTGTKTDEIDGETVIIPDPASWDLSYGNSSISYDYLGFGHTNTTISGVTGIEDGAGIYYLDVDNLAPAGIMTAGNWDTTHAGGGLTNSGLGLVADMLGTEYASYPINAGLADSPGAYPAKYSTAIHFQNNTIFDAYVEGCSWEPYDTAVTDTMIYLSNYTNATGLLFYIGGPPTVGHGRNEWEIDSISMARTDINYDLELYIPEFAEGRPPIINGSYTFSVWIKQDTDSATADIESVTLGISSYNTSEAYFKAYNVNELEEGQPVYPD
ncbi:MAG: hypothetical protein JW874_13890, partial [Spirochaetales bacterium]|nr:hypothetical protein [Spirochaetales bacterium]